MIPAAASRAFLGVVPQGSPLRWPRRVEKLKSSRLPGLRKNDAGSWIKGWKAAGLAFGHQSDSTESNLLDRGENGAAEKECPAENSRGRGETDCGFTKRELEIMTTKMSLSSHGPR